MKAKKRNWLIALVRDVNEKYQDNLLTVTFLFIKEDSVSIHDWKKNKTTRYSEREGEKKLIDSDEWDEEIIYDPGLVEAEKRLLELLKGVR